MQPDQEKKTPNAGANRRPVRPNPQVIQTGIGGVFLALGKTSVFVLIVVLILKFVFGMKF